MSRYREEEWLYQLVFALRSSKQKDDKSPFKRHLGQNTLISVLEKMCTLVKRRCVL